MTKILIVDDEFELAEILALTLQGLGYSCQWESDPLRAIDSLKETKFDLIITDMNMPGLDGLALIRSVRESGSDVVVVLCSGLFSDEQTSELPDRVVPMQKPLDLKRLETIIKEHCVDKPSN